MQTANLPCGCSFDSSSSPATAFAGVSAASSASSITRICLGWITADAGFVQWAFGHGDLHLGRDDRSCGMVAAGFSLVIGVACRLLRILDSFLALAEDAAVS